LSPFYGLRLRKIGLDLNNSPQRKEFESLNPHLVIDEAIKAFAQRYPILAAVQRLFTFEPTAVALPPQPLTAFSQQVQQGVMNNLSARKSDRLREN
jgi:hypothetical protein